MSYTPDSLFKIPLLAANLPNAWVIVNEALEDLAILHAGVLGIIDEPILSPEEGQAWIVSGTPSDIFANHENELVVYRNSAYLFKTPVEGWLLKIKSNPLQILYFTGSNWVKSTFTHSYSQQALNDNLTLTSSELIDYFLLDGGNSDRDVNLPISHTSGAKTIIKNIGSTNNLIIKVNSTTINTVLPDGKAELLFTSTWTVI